MVLHTRGVYNGRPLHAQAANVRLKGTCKFSFYSCCKDRRECWSCSIKSFGLLAMNHSHHHNSGRGKKNRWHPHLLSPPKTYSSPAIWVCRLDEYRGLCSLVALLHTTAWVNISTKSAPLTPIFVLIEDQCPKKVCSGRKIHLEDCECVGVCLQNDGEHVFNVLYTNIAMTQSSSIHPRWS